MPKYYLACQSDNNYVCFWKEIHPTRLRAVLLPMKHVNMFSLFDHTISKIPWLDFAVLDKALKDCQRHNGPRESSL